MSAPVRKFFIPASRAILDDLKSPEPKDEKPESVKRLEELETILAAFGTCEKLSSELTRLLRHTERRFQKFQNEIQWAPVVAGLSDILKKISDGIVDNIVQVKAFCSDEVKEQRFDSDSISSSSLSSGKVDESVYPDTVEGLEQPTREKWRKDRREATMAKLSSMKSVFNWLNGITGADGYDPIPGDRFAGVAPYEDKPGRRLTPPGSPVRSEKLVAVASGFMKSYCRTEPAIQRSFYFDRANPAAFQCHNCGWGMGHGIQTGQDLENRKFANNSTLATDSVIPETLIARAASLTTPNSSASPFAAKKAIFARPRTNEEKQLLKDPYFAGPYVPNFPPERNNQKDWDHFVEKLDTECMDKQWATQFEMARQGRGDYDIEKCCRTYHVFDKVQLGRGSVEWSMRQVFECYINLVRVAAKYKELNDQIVFQNLGKRNDNRYFIDQRTGEYKNVSAEERRFELQVLFPERMRRCKVRMVLLKKAGMSHLWDVAKEDHQFNYRGETLRGILALRDYFESVDAAYTDEEKENLMDRVEFSGEIWIPSRFSDPVKRKFGIR